MKDLIKYLIYEYAINVLFNQIKQNLFNTFNIKEFTEQYEQNPINGTQYKMLKFAHNGLIYQFYSVHVKGLSSNYIIFEFQSMMIFNPINDEEDIKEWGSDDSPIMMELDTLVESI